MDPGRYSHQQGWENNNSALEGYSAVQDPNFRADISYDDRRFVDERFSRDNIYSRNGNYIPPPGGAEPWPQIRRRTYEEEYPIDRDSRRLENYRGRYGGRDHSDYAAVDDDDYDYRPPRGSRQSREDSRERDYEYEYRHHSYDSDYDNRGGGGSRRDSSNNWRRRDSRERERSILSSRERDESPTYNTRRQNERSRSRGRDDRTRSRSPRGRRSSSYREDSYDDVRYDRRRERGDERRSHEHYSAAPSATVVVKGLPQKTSEEDLYQILAEWGPLRHVRVIKERSSGISRGFAFIDFPSTGAARSMMDIVEDDGLLVDGRRLFFEYSSKPTSGSSGQSFGADGSSRFGHVNHRSITVPSDWMCIICGCVNFARRTSCFQCNEPRGDDAPSADMASSNTTSFGKKGDTGPSHVLVVRGLDENADEEMLRYEFSKHVPIKDLRVVRDKFTHVSRGFAFVHFHSVEDATKALDATNGLTLEKNGQILRVAYAKSVLGPSATSSHSSSLAAAAIEAAAFSQQYDAVGWAPKEYNPDEKQSAAGEDEAQKNASAPQSGFVWDEASGYYYDAASGFYYDGNTGLYYDGNNGIWYTYDQQTQQYLPHSDQNKKETAKQTEHPKVSDTSNTRKVVISAPAATVTSNEKTSLPDAIQAAAAAAAAAEKKEKEKQKEIRLASKSSILANKKKMSNVLTMWKHRSHEGGQAPRVALDDNSLPVPVEDRSKSKPIKDINTNTHQNKSNISSNDDNINSTSKTAIMGVIRGSGRGVVKSDTVYSGPPVGAATSSSFYENLEASNSVTPFRTDASALGTYTPPVAVGGGKRRFSEMPLTPAQQPQITYRDRAAERRSLYGSSSSSFNEDSSEIGAGDSKQDSAVRKSVMDSMPFPPGVGGRGIIDGDANSEVVQSYDIITAEKAIDETNVGNRMLRNMGWQEGLGLGKNGSGMVEPVQTQSIEKRAGLGSQSKKSVDPNLEVHAGDSYRTLIQKKALARFREMS